MAVPPLIPELPPAPSRAQGQVAFNLAADPFIAALPPMVVNVNASLTWIGQQVTAVDGYRQAAATSAQNAASSATAAGQQVQLAADQVMLAKGQVDLAQAARTAAQAAQDSAQNFAAAAGSAAGLPALAGKAGKALLVNSTANGVVWGEAGDRIGDVLVSARNPGSNYIPADGSVYLKSAYTELFQLTGLLGGTKASSWSAITSGVGSNEITSIANNNNGTWLFVDSTGVLRISVNDGVTLTTVSGVALGASPAGVVYCGNSTFLAVGNTASNCYRSTDNGATWTLLAATVFATVSPAWSFDCCHSDGLGNILIGSRSGSLAYVQRSVNYGIDWTFSNIASTSQINAIGIGKDGKAFAVGIASGSSPATYQLTYSSTYGGGPWTAKAGVPTATGSNKLPSVDSDGNGVWVINMTTTAYRIGNNGDGSPLVLPVYGKVATDKNGTWLVGANVSTNDAIDFVTANLASPLPSSVSASRSGTFMAGATAGSLRRSVPTFPYDSATQFAVPNITSPVGVKSYIKAREAA